MSGDELRTGAVVYLWGVAAFASLSHTKGPALFSFLWPVIPIAQIVRRVFL